MIKKLMYLIIFTLMLTSCSAAKSNYDDKILVSSREIMGSDNPASAVHLDVLSSEFLDIKYTGKNTYELDVEIWEDGVLVNSMTEAMGIELSQYKGISIEVDESNPELYKVILGMYQEGGYTSMDFNIEVEPNALNGRVESDYPSDVEFAETEDVVLWGFHRFHDKFEAFGDTYDAAKKMGWSLVFVLRCEQ
ncbi:hypothetical protein [Fusibacter ferrireducens]|uniref:Uncharacterized protein n=1 Tax=Fusibacter ferrireducens TaxID=2785058 RepID=A0ABR9ZM34_9FIRM|nr:hypothetical protein [Fusibacter ferrireducens]MBF4691520.1 hypothetical protein [Fusibacter ferrireducens]